MEIMTYLETQSYLAQKYDLNMNASLVEIPDMGRDDLPALFHELGFTKGAEIGIEEGVYSEIICKGMPGVDLSCIDPWTAYRGYRDHVSQEKLDQFYLTAQEQLEPYSVNFVRNFSMEAVKQFDDGSLDFVYIDGNHELPWCMDDICAWRKKVRSGGIVSGHDYYESKRKHSKCHVKPTVNAAARCFRVRPLFIVGLRAKLEGLTRDTARSWFWVRE